MASIGKIQAALAAATNEVTLTAANLNFDFTLIKCEAPKEFNQLGTALSKKRRENAEHGSIHITARKLGALFEGMLPATPGLLQAYGNRVSEIAQSSKDTNPPEHENGMFAAHVGMDGTSIWAAATSSPTALHVQLLACMLARVWPSNEAVSVWVELVEERRKEVGDRFNANEAMPYSMLSAAAQAPITRPSLAEWDASARAWLRTADRVKVKQQDQLMLLIANLNVPINSNMAVYQSVIAGWISALEITERLIKGMPQAGNSGPCLLALSAWHIYPDMTVTGIEAQTHSFQDPEVRPGGRLTLGLSHRGINDKQGVYWSLSLAHLKHYGRPVARQASLGIQSKRLTFDQFAYAVFGAFLGHWDTYGSKAEVPAQFLVSFRDALRREVSKTEQDLPQDESISVCSGMLQDYSHGINILTRAAVTFLDAKDYPDDIVHKIMALGYKKAQKFMPQNPQMSFLALDDPARIISLLKGPDERVIFLRRIASGRERDHQRGTIIRYFAESKSSTSLGKSHSALSDDSVPSSRLCGLASAYMSVDPCNPTISHHVRWAPKPLLRSHPYPNEQINELEERDSFYYGALEDSFTLRYTSTEAEVLVEGLQKYEFVCGCKDLAAIFMDMSAVPNVGAGFPGSHRVPALETPLTIEELIWCLNSDLFDLDKLISHLDKGINSMSSEDETLRALAVAHRVYRALPDAHVSTSALNSPLYLTKWADYTKVATRYEYQEADKLMAERTSDKLSLEAAFACVANLEGGFDFDPRGLDRVFAIAYEDSIYVSMLLTCDPFEVPMSYELRRIAGNVGRPGLTLLVPPDEPMLSSREESSWHIVSTKSFDGLPENSFSKASMHVSFTDYYVPLIQSHDRVGHDSQVHILESVVSVYHDGIWIGDVDVLACLGSSSISRPLQWQLARCRKNHTPQHLDKLLSVESWDDIIEPPNRDAVVRAHGSWIARLATTVIAIQARSITLGDELFGTRDSVTVVPKDVCWACAEVHMVNIGRNRDLTSTIRLPQTSTLFIY